MSKINARANLQNTEWEITFENIQSIYADLIIGFQNDVCDIHFKDIKFKYELKQDSNIRQYGIFPLPGCKYVCSNQEHLISERLNLQPETEYEIYLWMENDRKSFDKSVIFTTPRPQQPYSSWSWDGENWNSPISYPDDGGYYTWNEEIQNWTE